MPILFAFSVKKGLNNVRGDNKAETITRASRLVQFLKVD